MNFSFLWRMFKNGHCELRSTGSAAVGLCRDRQEAEYRPGVTVPSLLDCLWPLQRAPRGSISFSASKLAVKLTRPNLYLSFFFFFRSSTRWKKPVLCGLVVPCIILEGVSYEVLMLWRMLFSLFFFVSLLFLVECYNCSGWTVT